jgi:hypothetical protein
VTAVRFRITFLLVMPLINLVVIHGARLESGIRLVRADSGEGGELGEVAGSFKEIESAVVGMESICIEIGVSTGQWDKSLDGNGIA